MLKVLLLVFVCQVTTSLTSQGVRKSTELRRQCSVRGEATATLDTRSASADVVLTGTILNLMPEMTSRVVESAISGTVDFPQSQGKDGRTVTAYVKVWAVMKGSIDDIPDKKRIYKKRKRSADRSKNDLDRNQPSNPVAAEAVADGNENNPVIELHGLWNSYLCGSYLKEGDTRVFFLRKMTDHRPARVRQTRSTSMKKKKRNKKRDKKREAKRKHRKRRKQKKNKQKHKKSKKGKLAKPLNSLSSPSVGTTWKQLMLNTKQKKSKINTNERKKTTQPVHTKSVLLVHYEPARITLKNLHSVESVVKDQKK